MHKKDIMDPDCLSRYICSGDCILPISFPVWRHTEQNQQMRILFHVDFLFSYNKEKYKNPHHIISYFSMHHFNRIIRFTTFCQLARWC